MRLVLRLLSLSTAGLMLLGCGSQGRKISQEEKLTMESSIYDVSLKSLNEAETIDLSALKGKYILFVNVASKCGYTPQYEGLQALYEQYSDKLEIIGAPCNQFGFQEPGDSSEIATFCSVNYGVSFPIAEKLDVKGENQHPLYTWLTSKDYNEKDNYSVSWNFNKFLVSPEGKLIAYFPSKTKPQSEEITSLIK